MSVFFDDTVSGVGSFNMGAQRINYFLFHTYELGVEAKEASIRDSDYLLRMGWITFGTTVELPDLGTIEYWRAPIWLNYYNTIWTPVAQTDIDAHDFAIWCTHVRWSLSTDLVGRLVVVGV
jgi:hypothetical protein